MACSQGTKDFLQDIREDYSVPGLVNSLCAAVFVSGSVRDTLLHLAPIGYC